MVKIGFWQTRHGLRIVKEAEFIGRNPYNGYYGCKLEDGLVMWLERKRIAWIDDTTQLPLKELGYETNES